MKDPWFKKSLSERELRSYTQRHIRRKKPGFIRWIGGLNVTGWLILVNVLFFIVEMILISTGIDFNYLALQPQAFFEQGTVWTLLTSMFMHAPAIFSFHLFINMFVLFSLGGLTEKLIGGKRFLWFYILSGIFAGLVHVFLIYFLGNSYVGARILGDPLIPALGASGAIFAIAGLLMILAPRLKFMIIFLPFFSLPAYVMIPLILFAVWIITSVIALVSGGSVVMGNVAHFGGFIAGVGYGLYLKYKYPRKTRMIGKMFSRQ